jgi:hypothetical protein
MSLASNKLHLNYLDRLNQKRIRSLITIFINNQGVSMSLVPFLKAGFLYAATFLLVTAAASADVLTEPLYIPPAGHQGASVGGFALPDFNPSLGTLQSVELTLRLSPRRTVTIYNSANPSQNWVNLVLQSGGNSRSSSTDLANFEGNLGGPLLVSFQKGRVPVRKMGLAGYILFYDGHPHVTGSIDVNYNFVVASAQPTPEPSGGFLASIAASAMMVMLISRRVRRAA